MSISFEHGGFGIAVLEDNTLVLQPVNSDVLFKFTMSQKLLEALKERRWFYRCRGDNHFLFGFLREPDEKQPQVARIEQIYLGPIPWLKKIHFLNGDKTDYRKENVRLLPRKRPKTSW